MESEAVVQIPALMNQHFAARYLGKSVAWLERCRWDGTGPKFVKIGRSVRYRADDLLEYLDANTHTSNQSPGNGGA